MESATQERLRAVGVAAVVAVTGFALGVVAITVLALLYVGLVDSEISPVENLFLSLVGLQGIGFPVTAWLYLRRRGLSADYLNVRWPTARELAVSVGGWLLILAGLVVVSILVSLTGTDTATNQAAETAIENPQIIPYLVPLVFLLNAPGEELLFRGVIQGSLREHFGPAASVVLATSMFAPAHFVALLGSFQAMLVSVGLLFVPGLVFGAVYEYTGNLVVPSLTHGYNNAFIFLLIYLGSTGAAGGGLLVH